MAYTGEALVYAVHVGATASAAPMNEQLAIIKFKCMILN